MLKKPNQQIHFRFCMDNTLSIVGTVVDALLCGVPIFVQVLVNMMWLL